MLINAKYPLMQHYTENGETARCLMHCNPLMKRVRLGFLNFAILHVVQIDDRMMWCKPKRGSYYIAKLDVL